MLTLLRVFMLGCAFEFAFSPYLYLDLYLTPPPPPPRSGFDFQRAVRTLQFALSTYVDVRAFLGSSRHTPLRPTSISRSYNGVVAAAEEEDHPLVVLYSPPSTSISLVLFPSFLAFSCPLSPVPSSSSYPYAVICVCSLGPPVVVIDICVLLATALPVLFLRSSPLPTSTLTTMTTTTSPPYHTPPTHPSLHIRRRIVA